MKKILWLASWYPNKISQQNGDFIQRHAEAVAIFQPIEVIFVVKDEYGIVTDHVTIENFSHGNLCETVAYYKPYASGIKTLDRIVSVITFFKVFNKLVTAFIKSNGIPKLVHVHVAMWAGLVAVWLKVIKGIPYIVTEHWTGYHKNAIESIYNKGWIFKKISISILKNADLLLPDSHHLGVCIHDNIFPVKFLHVSNVVNTDYFNSSLYQGSEFRFIHVSSMKPQKNAQGLLRAFSKLLLTHKNCRLIMVGPVSDDLRREPESLTLKDRVKWMGSLSYNEVAPAMTASSVLVMFSRYENQPCVILEALCLGLPVISTNVGGIPEVINENNGILIDSENETQLVQAMINMVNNYKEFNKTAISKSAKAKYNYSAIGKIISDLYRSYPGVG